MLSITLVHNGLLIAGANGTNSVGTSVSLANGQISVVHTNDGIAVLVAKSVNLTATILVSSTTGPFSGSFSTSLLNTWKTSLINDLVGANILFSIDSQTVTANIIGQQTVSGGNEVIVASFYENTTSKMYYLTLNVGSSTTTWTLQAGDYYTKTESDNKYFAKIGGTLSGNLNLANGYNLLLDNGTTLSATSLAFLNNGSISAKILTLQSLEGNVNISNYRASDSIVLTSGASGSTTIDGTAIPKNVTLVSSTDLASKVSKSGDTMTGQLFLPAAGLGISNLTISALTNDLGFAFTGGLNPNTDNTLDLGAYETIGGTDYHYRWKDIYLSGVLSDGTNEIHVADIESSLNKVTTLSDLSTHTQYPSAACVYNALLLKANSADVVHKAGEEIITGKKIIDSTGITGTSCLSITNVSSGTTYNALSLGVDAGVGLIHGDHSVSISTNDTIYLSAQNMVNISVNSNTYLTLANSTIYCDKNAIPTTTGSLNLGSSDYKWNNLYLSGSLSDGTHSVSIADISAVAVSGMTLNTEQTVTAKKTFSLTNVRDVAFDFGQYSLLWNTQSGSAANQYKMYGLVNTGMQVTNGSNTITLPVYTKTGTLTVESELQQAIQAALNAVGQRLGFTCTGVTKNADGTYSPQITDTANMRVFGVAV